MRMDTYKHFTDKPIVELHSVKEQKDLRLYKPNGFWISDETDHGWKQWCIDEEFNLDRLNLVYTVTVDLSNILQINTEAALLLFDRYFAKGGNRFSKQIDWDLIAQRYSGIIITPYQWGQRLDLMWYYGWDCASGCIWDVSAVKSIELDK